MNPQTLTCKIENDVSVMHSNGGSHNEEIRKKGKQERNPATQ